MKKTFFLILFILCASYINAYDFKLIPKIIKSQSHPGYYSKIPLGEMVVKDGKLDFYVQKGYDYISFEGDYNEKKGELKGILKVATEYSENKAYIFYCEFSAIIQKDKKTTEFVFDGSSVEKCNSRIVFDIQKNSMSQKDLWWPDNLVFEVVEIEGLEDSGIRFSDISGEVEILLPTGYNEDGEPLFEDEEGWNHAKLDMKLPYGAKIRLKERSSIILSLPTSEPYEMRTPENLYPYDETIVMLPLKQKKESILKLMSGQLYNNVKKIIKDGTMDIELGQAVAGIKGTTFILEEDGKKSTIKVIEGEVEFRSKMNNQKEFIKQGEMITANEKGLNEKTTFSIEEESKKWNYHKGISPVFIILSMVVLVFIIGFLFIGKVKVAKNKRHN
ncbi:MAG: FecR family protein [Candidatus Woesearchaeota archaeon]